jgi:hypothetical protein
MSDDAAVTPPESIRCPWCSTIAPAGASTCSSCGAALIASSEGSVPGVTSIDAEAVLRGRTTARPRGGLLGLLSGETGDTVDAPSAAELTSLAPPPVSVRMEMMRLELDAERQRLEAEAAGMAADAVVDGEISRIPPGVLAAQRSDAASPNGSPAAEDTSGGAPASDAGMTAETAATPASGAAPAAGPAPGASPAPGPTSAGDGTPDSGASAVR